MGRIPFRAFRTSNQISDPQRAKRLSVLILSSAKPSLDELPDP